jgi:hypothetical protein
MAQYEVVVADDTFQYEFLEPDGEVPELAAGETVDSYLNVIVRHPRPSSLLILNAGVLGARTVALLMQGVGLLGGVMTARE